MTSNKLQSLFTSKTVIGELEALEVRHPQFSARLFLQGAHLTHFAPDGAENWLWLSPDAQFLKGRAIRGGIPVCWPWFGDPGNNPGPVAQRIQSTQAHGFTRTLVWTLDDVTESDQQVEITLSLDAREANHTFGHWPLSAQIAFRFTRDQCRVALTTHNPGRDEVSYTEALHTYFPTPDIQRTTLEGFDGTRFTDTLGQWEDFTESGCVHFQGETDRIYHAGGPVRINTPTQTIRLETSGSDSTVVWNPGPEKARRLSDFPDDAWKTMLCVETANASPGCIRLMEGQTHTTSLLLSQE